MIGVPGLGFMRMGGLPVMPVVVPTSVVPAAVAPTAIAPAAVRPVVPVRPTKAVITPAEMPAAPAAIAPPGRLGPRGGVRSECRRSRRLRRTGDLGAHVRHRRAYRSQALGDARRRGRIGRL